MSESNETWAEVMAAFLNSLPPDEQEARLIERLLLCPSTAACERELADAVERLDTLAAQQARQTRLATARAQVARWQAQLRDCQERDRRVAERQELAPEYEDCECLGQGGSGPWVGLVVLGTAGEVLLARVDGEVKHTRERVCACPDGQAFAVQVEQWRVTASEQLRARRVARIAGAADIPVRYRGLTLDTWAEAAEAAGGTPEVVRHTLEWARGWSREAQSHSAARLLLLGGNQGVGKSGLAAALAQEWVDQERGVLYRSMERLAAELRAAPWRASREPDALPTELQLLEALSEADLLILDDLGVEALTAANEAVMLTLIFGILDRRMTGGRATIVTSNLTSDEIMARYGARIHDRLVAPEVSICIEVAVPNLRWPGGAHG